MPYLGLWRSPGDVSKMKIHQKLMTNTLNHFSEIGKHVLAVEIKVYGFWQPKYQNAKNVDNHSLKLEAIRSVTRDQSTVCRVLYCTPVYCTLYCTVLTNNTRFLARLHLHWKTVTSNNFAIFYPNFTYVISKATNQSTHQFVDDSCFVISITKIIISLRSCQQDTELSFVWLSFEPLVR